MSTTPTPESSESTEDLLGRVATKTLQPQIDRLRQMADEARLVAEHARVQAQVQKTTAAAHERLERGYRQAVDYLLAGLPADNVAPQPVPTTPTEDHQP